MEQEPPALPEADQPEPAGALLRGLPIEISEDFDAPLPEIWEARAND